MIAVKGPSCFRYGSSGDSDSFGSSYKEVIVASAVEVIVVYAC